MNIIKLAQPIIRHRLFDPMPLPKRVYISSRLFHSHRKVNRVNSFSYTVKKIVF